MPTRQEPRPSAGRRSEATRRPECRRSVGCTAGEGAGRKDRDAAREQLRQQLNVILETRETARGLIVNLSDVLFDVDKATLKPGAREKLARIAGILASHPDLKIEIEGHADSTGRRTTTCACRSAVRIRARLLR